MLSSSFTTKKAEDQKLQDKKEEAANIGTVPGVSKPAATNASTGEYKTSGDEETPKLSSSEYITIPELEKFREALTSATSALSNLTASINSFC